MIVESHWRRLKHDYLHRFNRPRIDLVTWILAKRVIPEATEKMKGLIEGNHRMATAAWRKPFKRQWKVLQNKEVNPDSLLRYHTAPMKWVCACEAFLESRFLLCKHLKHCLERFSNPSAFFREVRRRRTSPFWEHAQTVVHAEFKSIEYLQGIDIESSSVDSNLDSDDFSDCSSLESEDEQQHEVEGQSEDEANPFEYGEACCDRAERAISMAREQIRKGNEAFMKRFLPSLTPLLTLEEEADRKQKR